MEVELLGGMDVHEQSVSWESWVAHVELMGALAGSPGLAGAQLTEGESLESMADPPLPETSDGASSMVDAALEEDSQDMVEVHTPDNCFL